MELDLNNLVLEQKKALAYDLLIERDVINNKLRLVQQSIAKESEMKGDFTFTA